MSSGGQTPSHRDIFAVLAELSAKVDGLSDRIGAEQTDDRGNVSGTGLTGRIIRTEARVLAYDRLKDRAIGALATASVALAVLWWLTKQKIATVFGVSA